MEGAGRVLDGVDEQVVQQFVVGKRGGVDRVAAAPAADQVQKGVGTAEALGEGGGPGGGTVVGEQVGDAGVDALVGQAEVGL